MSASGSWTKTLSARAPQNPNSCIMANADCQDETTDYSFKLNGSFELPKGFKASPVYRFQAGSNFSRTFVGKLNYTIATLNAEAANGERYPDINLIDLRIDRGIQTGKGRISPFFDVYNITNANPEQNLTVASGSSWLRPVNIVPPRVARIGVKFDW